MLKVKELLQEDHMIFVIRCMSCKCVRSITNGSDPHAKKHSVVSSHIVSRSYRFLCLLSKMLAVFILFSP